MYKTVDNFGTTVDNYIMDYFFIVPLIYAAFNAFCGVAYYYGWADSDFMRTYPESKERGAVLKFMLATSAIAVFAALASLA